MDLPMLSILLGEFCKYLFFFDIVFFKDELTLLSKFVIEFWISFELKEVEFFLS